MVDSPVEFRPFQGKAPEQRYVAFLDILGFGQQTLNDFEETVAAYDEFINSAQWHETFNSEVSLRIYSDSLMLCSPDLAPLLSAVNMMQFFALTNDRLVRGGVGFGEHIEVSDKGNLFVVSKALVRAVNVEKTVRKPCVAIHPDIPLHDRWWKRGRPNNERVILHFDGMSIVSPFNIAWGFSAMTRIAMMSAKYPEYSDKLDWFLSLYTAWTEATELVPGRNI